MYRRSMHDVIDPLAVVRPLLRTRQVRQYTTEPVSAEHLHAITEVARWSGSSRNNQPWRFLVIRDEATLRALHQSSLPQTRSLETAIAGIAIVLSADPDRLVEDTYDEGRAAERMLIAANMLGLGAAIAWVKAAALPGVRPLLGLPEDRLVRTVIALGHPTQAAQAPKAAPGQARISREESVLEERWPS